MGGEGGSIYSLLFQLYLQYNETMYIKSSDSSNYEMPLNWNETQAVLEIDPALMQFWWNADLPSFGVICGWFI